VKENEPVFVKTNKQKRSISLKKRKIYSKISLVSLLAAVMLLVLSRAPAQQKEPEVPYVSTPDEVVAEMLRIANVGKDDVVYDLGCGDGRIVITAAKMYGCRGVGIDINPERIRESRENAIKAGVSDKVQFIQMDLFEADITEASVVTIYLLSGVNLRLRPKLFRELSPGSRVVSHEFSMGKWEPDATAYVKAENYRDPYLFNYWDQQIADYWRTHKVYLWVVPGNVNGTWKLTIPDIAGKSEFTLRFDHEFQRVRGQVLDSASSVSVFVKDVEIRGNMLHFTLEGKLKDSTEIMRFEGILQGNTMKGTMEIEGSPRKGKIKWTARRDLSTLRPIVN
jgi:SAM-dependent methyltransferase